MREQWSMTEKWARWGKQWSITEKWAWWEMRLSIRESGACWWIWFSMTEIELGQGFFVQWVKLVFLRDTRMIIFVMGGSCWVKWEDPREQLVEEGEDLCREEGTQSGGLTRMMRWERKEEGESKGEGSGKKPELKCIYGETWDNVQTFNPNNFSQLNLTKNSNFYIGYVYLRRHPIYRCRESLYHR